MLWWLIGGWVASGLLIPTLWLLSVAGHGFFVRSSHDIQEEAAAPSPPPSSKRTRRNRGHIGRFLLSGLVGVGALILLFIGSFSDPMSTMGFLYSAFADAQDSVSQAAVTSAPAQEAVKQTDHNQTGTVGPDFAREADLAAPQIPPVWALKAALSAVTPPAHPQRPSKHGWQYGRHGPVSAFVAVSRPSTWLFPPDASGGGNN